MGQHVGFNVQAPSLMSPGSSASMSASDCTLVNAKCRTESYRDWPFTSPLGSLTEHHHEVFLSRERLKTWSPARDSNSMTSESTASKACLTSGSFTASYDFTL